MRYRLITSLPVYTGLYIASLVMAFLLRFDLCLTPSVMENMWTVMPYFLVIKTAVFICGSEWRRYHRYTTMSDLAYIIGLRTVASTLTFAFFLTGLAAQSPPRSVLLIDWLLTLLGIILLRASVRYVREQSVRQARPSDRKRTMVYGADAVSYTHLRAHET